LESKIDHDWPTSSEDENRGSQTSHVQHKKTELNIYNILTTVNSTSQHPDTFGVLMVFMLRAKEGDSLSKIRKMISALGLITWRAVGFVRIFSAIQKKWYISSMENSIFHMI